MMKDTPINISFYTLFFVIITLIGCNGNNEKEEITRIVKEWQDKKIIFPEDIVFTRYGVDTLTYTIPETAYKILLYVDSVGCTGCKLQLHKWKEFISQVDSLTNYSVPVLFFFHPKDKRELAYLLKRDGISVPVCLDEDDKLNFINKFPSREDLQCFLLDSNNKVLFIGNPIHNIRIREMYLSKIAPETHAPITSSRNTTITVNEAEFDLGTLAQGKSVSIKAMIRNTGEVPLVVYDTHVSCGCTNVSYSKEPVAPGSEMQIEITYRADDLGYFNKTVSVYGNIDSSPLVLRLKGNTK